MHTTLGKAINKHLYTNQSKIYTFFFLVFFFSVFNEVETQGWPGIDATITFVVHIKKMFLLQQKNEHTHTQTHDAYVFIYLVFNYNKKKFYINLRSYSILS